MWTEHLEALAKTGFRAVAPDLPGFGEAQVTEGEQAPWQDVLALMDDLSIERAAVVGVSFGGAVALRVAVVAPERVSALVLVSAPAPDVEPSPELEAAWAAEEAALERGDVEAAVAAVVDAWTLPDASPEVRARVADMQRRAYELQDVDELDEAPDPLDDHPEALSTLDVPTLIAVGERDKPDFIAAASSLAQKLPRARHEVIAGAGHLAPLEAQEAFRELLLRFLS
jgi:3-oxoadipate enol-lactonase